MDPLVRGIYDTMLGVYEFPDLKYNTEIDAAKDILNWLIETHPLEGKNNQQVASNIY